MLKKIITLYYLWYQNELSTPDLLGVFVNPFYKIRRDLCRSVKSYSHRMSGRMLDFGCGSKPYKKYFRNITEYIGLDYENDSHVNNRQSVDVFYDGNKIPYKDEYFDCVLSTETLEHVFNIDQIISEINRVLKKGGLLLITIPFVWDEHEQPNDYARYTSFGIQYLFNKYGFRVVSSKKMGNYIDTLTQMYCTYLYKHLYSKNFILNVIAQFIIISPTMILGILASYIFPKNYDFYNNNAMLLKKEK